MEKPYSSPDNTVVAGMSNPASVLLVLLVYLLVGAGCGPPDAGNVDQGQPVDLGSEIYQQDCATCHGARGEVQPDWRSKGLDGRYPAPPHDSTGHTWHHGDGLLFGIMKNGGTSLNIPNFESGMPSFAQKLNDKEIQAVITHLKTIWGTDEREFQRKASQQDPFPVVTDGP